MTPEAFTRWLDAMKENDDFRFDIDAARALGVSNDTIVSYKKRGGDTQLGLACAALYHRLQPFE